MNAQCPKCGSGLRPYYGNSFACGSVLYVDGLLKGTFREGMRCTSLQLARAKSRVAELEAEAKQAREDEAWANDRTVLVEFQPLTSGWYASAPDGVVGINATAPTIHGAIRALREKMEAKP